MVAADVTVPRVNHIPRSRGLQLLQGRGSVLALQRRVSKWTPAAGATAGLTQWLFDPKNPMTARVCVNRIYKRRGHFGNGIECEDRRGLRHPGGQPVHPAPGRTWPPSSSALGWDDQAHAEADGDVGHLHSSRRPSPRTCWRRIQGFLLAAAYIAWPGRAAARRACSPPGLAGGTRVGGENRALYAPCRRADASDAKDTLSGASLAVADDYR